MCNRSGRSPRRAIQDRLDDLKVWQRLMKRDSEEFRREQRNEDRRRQRLLIRAQGLSDDALVQMLAVRAAAAKAKAKTIGKAKAKGKDNDKGGGKGCVGG